MAEPRKIFELPLHVDTQAPASLGVHVDLFQSDAGIQSPSSQHSTSHGSAASPGDDPGTASKREATVRSYQTDSTSSPLPGTSMKNGPQIRNRPWKPAAFRFGPLAGFGAMLLALASIIASLGVLVSSDGASVQQWRAADPSIILAVCTAVANLSIRYACIQGVVFYWWTKALQGSSLWRLHHDWRAGTLVGALTSGRNIGLLGVATILSTVVVIDGPLLQRSTSIRSAAIVGQTVSMNVSMAPEIPTDFTGFWQTANELGIDQDWMISFNSTQPGANGTVPNNIYPFTSEAESHETLSTAYFTDDPLADVVSGCKDKCKARIRAPALAITSCVTTTFPVDYHKIPKGYLYDPGHVAFPLDNLVFVADSNLIVNQGDTEKINLVIAYSENQDCVGTLHQTACTLSSAIGEYDITVNQNMVTLDSPGSPTIIAIANNSRIDRYTTGPNGTSPAHTSTLGGITTLHHAQWEALSAMSKYTGQLSAMVYNRPVLSRYMLPPNSSCPAYRNPFQDAYASINKLMVYAGAIAAQHNASSDPARMDPGWQTRSNTKTTARVVGDHLVFNTDYWFFFAAALVEVVCIAAILPTYRGWYELGRPVSFSPLELAKAFQSPLLAECNSNSSGRDLSKLAGHMEIQYGATSPDQTGGGKTKLTFAKPHEVCKPAKGTQFGV